MRIQQRGRQGGMTMIGFLCIAAMVGVIGYGAVRLLPVYLNQFKVQKILNDVKSELDNNGATPTQVSTAIEKRLDIEMIEFPNRKDFTIEKSDVGLTVGVSYEDRVPFLGDIFLGAEFDNSVDIVR